MKQFLNRYKQRGALFIEYALILSFVIIIGMFFISSNNNIITSINNIFGETSTILTDAAEEKGQQQGGSTSNKPEDDPHFAETQFEDFTNDYGNKRGGNLNSLAQNISDVFWNALQPYSNPSSNDLKHYAQQDVKSIQFVENGHVVMTFHDGSYLEGNVDLTNNNVKKEWAMGTTGTFVYDTNRKIVQHDGDLYTYVTIAGKEYGYKP